MKKLYYCVLIAVLALCFVACESTEEALIGRWENGSGTELASPLYSPEWIEFHEDRTLLFPDENGEIERAIWSIANRDLSVSGTTRTFQIEIDNNVLRLTQRIMRQNTMSWQKVQ